MHGAQISATVTSSMQSSFLTGGPAEPSMKLLEMLHYANRQVNDYLRWNPGTQSGSTVVAVLIKGASMHFISVGDSRIYLCRGKTLTQLNREHTYASDLDEKAAKGEISLEEAMSDPQRKALTSYIGMGDVIRLMSRQLGEAMMDSLGVRVEDTFSVGIDLEKALANPGSTADIVLREGDVISIPKNNNTVTINGAVMVPNTVSYIKGEDIDYYLNQAGGYSENAKKSKKFIVYMNGQVTKVKGSGKKQIEPGCEIIVPSKAKKKTNIGNILGYATTFSTLGMMVASIANLIKK